MGGWVGGVAGSPSTSQEGAGKAVWGNRLASSEGDRPGGVQPRVFKKLRKNFLGKPI